MHWCLTEHIGITDNNISAFAGQADLQAISGHRGGGGCIAVHRGSGGHDDVGFSAVAAENLSNVVDHTGADTDDYIAFAVKMHKGTAYAFFVRLYRAFREAVGNHLCTLGSKGADFFSCCPIGVIIGQNKNRLRRIALQNFRQSCQDPGTDMQLGVKPVGFAAGAGFSVHIL